MKTSNYQNENTDKKGVSVLSLIALLTSIIGFVLYGFMFEIDNVNIILPIWVIISIFSIILPIIAKAVRLKNNQKGKIMEIISIVIGGFNFYCIIFAITKLPIFIGYLGWIVCAIIYKIIK